MRVLFVDNHLLVVSKPAGALVQGDRTGDANLLEEARSWVEREFNKPGKAFLGLVHRLDRPVSGVVVFARTSKAAARLSDQFRNRTVRKSYLALTTGLPTGEPRCVDYLAKRGKEVQVVKPGAPGAKRAELTWRKLAAVGDRALLQIELETGRQHQIRVQLASRGASIIGDFRYGSRVELDGKNMALHAARLLLDHPTRRERMAFGEPPPPSWGPRFVEAGQLWLDAQPL